MRRKKRRKTTNSRWSHQNWVIKATNSLTEGTLINCKNSTMSEIKGEMLMSITSWHDNLRQSNGLKISIVQNSGYLTEDTGT